MAQRKDRLPVLLLACLVMACGSTASAGQAPASVPAAEQPDGRTATVPPSAVPIDLKLDVEPAMFHGTVAAIDPSDASITIRTDYGLVLRLFSTHCQDLSGLREGDRVLVEPDPEGPLTVTAMDRTLSHPTENPISVDGAAWASGHCGGETI